MFYEQPEKNAIGRPIDSCNNAYKEREREEAIKTDK